MPAKSKSVRKSAAKKAPDSPPKTRSANGTKSSPKTPKTPRATPATRKAAAKPASAAASAAAPRPHTPPVSVANKAEKPKGPVTLGPPKVVGEELLDLVFKDDFYARQIFVFLGVRTVNELEQFQPGQIYEKATGPIRESIERIRERLALLNRALAGDQEFAVKYLG